MSLYIYIEPREHSGKKVTPHLDNGLEYVNFPPAAEHTEHISCVQLYGKCSSSILLLQNTSFVSPLQDTRASRKEIQKMSLIPRNA